MRVMEKGPDHAGTSIHNRFEAIPEPVTTHNGCGGKTEHADSPKPIPTAVGRHAGASQHEA